MRRPALVLAPWLSLCLLLGACVRVEAGTDPEPLGYGPGPEARLANGYDREVAPRPAPVPWNPPRSLLAEPRVSAAPTSGPVPYNDDLIAVCEHLATVTTAPADAAQPGFDRDACLARYRVERVFRPLPDWKQLAACILATGDGDGDGKGVDACLAAHPRAFAPVPDYPRETAVCMHIFAITIVEQLGPEPMLDAARLIEFEPLLRDCVDSLVTEERADRKPAEYVEMLECIERARTTAAAEACE